LREKRQAEAQLEQAAHAVSLFFQMQQPLMPAKPRRIQYSDEGKAAHDDISAIKEHPGSWSPSSDSASPEPLQMPTARGVSGYVEAGYQIRSDSPEWDELLATLAAEIKVRHYSRKTLKTYANWSRQFQRFLKNKTPSELSTSDVRDYLTFLAVKCQVAASTQNQA
jgi:hypothetical protein